MFAVAEDSFALRAVAAATAGADEGHHQMIAGFDPLHSWADRLRDAGCFVAIDGR